MMDKDFRTELDRRLDLYEDPGSEEGVLAPLPAKDIVISVAVLVIVSLIVLGWALL
ncbi:hypothetical protein [Brevibacterium marinum]|uniref:Uncharacterized protein n=1 Tax=Brevibacterium marinum TaxID=418643 RepID=A0A846S470_9MICO|nr:hypothetical protein [Brevibacterium marinum]NJC58390.1 hypothetical protein [Brevibacterium marinum]